jgi:hypothetical protein
MNAFAHFNHTDRLIVRLPDEIIQQISYFSNYAKVALRCIHCSNPVLLLRKTWWITSKATVEYVVHDDGHIWNLKNGFYRRPCNAANAVNVISLLVSQGTVTSDELPSHIKYGDSLYENAYETYIMLQPYFFLSTDCVCYMCKFRNNRIRRSFLIWRSYHP